MIEEALRRIEISKNENLHYLDLRGLELTEIPNELLELPHLQSLSLSHNKLTDLTLLAQFPNLHKLALSDNTISDISVLKKLPKLRFIFLANNQIKDISPIVTHARLKKLVLNNNEINFLPDLSNIPLLAYLDVSMNNLTPPQPHELLKVLPLLKIYKV